MAVIWTSADRGMAFYLNDGNVMFSITDNGGVSWNDPKMIIVAARDSEQLSVRVDYYSWFRGAAKYDSAFANHLAIITHSQDEVNIIRMDAETLEVLDGRKKKFQPPIIEINSTFRFDGAISLAVISEVFPPGEFPIYIIKPPEGKSTPNP